MNAAIQALEQRQHQLEQYIKNSQAQVSQAESQIETCELTIKTTRNYIDGYFRELMEVKNALRELTPPGPCEKCGK